MGSALTRSLTLTMEGNAVRLDVSAPSGDRFEPDGKEGFGFIETRGYKFRAVLSGPEDGVPLIYATGTGGFMAKTTGPQTFGKQGFRCLGIDHRNTGETRPFTTDQGYTHPDEYIDDLIACGLAVFGPGVPVRLVGYSIGAYFVQWAQHRYPEHVVAGANVSGGLFMPIPAEVDYGDIDAVMGCLPYQDGRWWSVEWFKKDREQGPGLFRLQLAMRAVAHPPETSLKATAPSTFIWIGTQDKVHTQEVLEALAALQEPEGATVKRRDADHCAVDDDDIADISAFLKKF